jgi:hypothetical protein
MIPSKKKLGILRDRAKVEEVYATNGNPKTGDHSPGGPIRTRCQQNALSNQAFTKAEFYKWYKAYLEKGSEGLSPVHKTRQQWNSIAAEQRQLIVALALEHTELSPRALAVKLTDEQKVFISESSVCVP